MRILMIGDIVGKPGRQLVVRSVPGLKVREKLDFVVANAENISGGSGITPAIYHELLSAGVDCITMGDHVYRRREIVSILETEARIVKPANYPDEAPGADLAVHRAADGTRVGVFSLLGRVFMQPVDSPFAAANRILRQFPRDIRVILLDFHAEATSDMQLMGRHLDGRVSAVLGTHTHVQTADEQIFPGGTAFQCDVGMAGPCESILGRRIDRVLKTTLTAHPTHFDVATGDVRIHGTIVDVDPATGKATAIKRLVVMQDEVNQLATLVRR